jgi:hypothetical protein
MYGSSNWLGFRCVGSSVTAYGKEVRRQVHEPVDLSSSTSDTEGQSDQSVKNEPVDLSSTSDTEGLSDQSVKNEPVDLSSSTSDNEGQSYQPVRRSLEAQWHWQFEKLGEFKEKHGHCEFFCFLTELSSS